MPVAVVTDTTHYIPRETARRHGVVSVPLYVSWNGRTDPESALEDLEPFYAHLSESERLPTTSQPSVGDFLSVYEPLLRAGSDIASIHLSSGLSGTLGAAEQARERLVEQGLEPERLRVIDSATACGGAGLVVLAAANATAAGEGLDAVARRAAALRAELEVRFALDTMEFLRRGGRIGSARAWVGSTLKIKPILTIESQIEPVERVRTWSRAVERLVEHLGERREQGHDAWFVQHARAAGEAQRLIERGREMFGSEPDFVSEIGPVIGTHCGPGMLGVAAIRRELLGPV